MATYYDVLGIESNATQVEIKRAYKEKALIYHPDRNSGDSNMEELFKEINTAYQILSNSYSRSNYDLMLKYGNQTSANYHQPPPPPTYRTKRPPIYRQKVNSKENLKATLYAFLFAFSVAVIVKTSLYFVEKHRKEELALILKERRDVFKRVKEKKESGELVQSLAMIEEMGRFYTEEYYMRDYRDGLIYDIRDEADLKLENGEFDKALAYYEVLSDYAISSNYNYMLKMAKAYRGKGELKKTLRIYQRLRMYGYKNANFFFDIADLYEVGGNPEQALNYYTQSSQMAAHEYEVTIGKAYPVVINADMIPKKHYFIYLKVSEMHLVLGQYEEAIQSLAWSKEIWTDSLQLFEMEAMCYQALGREKELHESIERAKRIDPNFSL
ncbi:MAG: DnaJ domain-containing protein [Reichenbachiella sp.]